MLKMINQNTAGIVKTAQTAPTAAKVPLKQEPHLKSGVSKPAIAGDTLDLGRHFPKSDMAFGCIPPVSSTRIESYLIKTRGVTGEASVRKDIMGNEQVYVKGENGKSYRLTGPEAEAVKAAVKAAGPFEKVEVTVKGDLGIPTMMHGPSIATDSVSIDVKSRFEREWPVRPFPVPQPHYFAASKA